MAIIDATEELSKALDNKKITIGVFIDLKKAFDTINHAILLKKLERYGIRGVAGNWIKSYLSDRVQYVEMGEFSSECCEISCGVPQGSVLGPKLFNLYINDIFQVSKLIKCVLFADDTNIFYCDDNFDKAINIINTELSNIKKWMDSNKLSLNLDKTKAILFGNYMSKTDKTIEIEGIQIDYVSEIKFLGVTIDNRLTWKTHIRHIQTKISKSLAIINKAKQVLDVNILRTLYCTLILPYLSYCVEVWGNNYNNAIHSLCMLQKRAIRIINKAKFLDHTNPLFIESKLLKLQDLIKLHTLQLSYKAYYNLLPVNLQKLFIQREQLHSLRRHGNFLIPRINTIRRSFCATIRGIKLWNSLGHEYKQCRILNQFKVLYKKMVLTNYKESGAQLCA